MHQTELERAVALQFEAYNELGDLVPCTLVTEIMGRHSNVILVDREGKIIDALKRVDEDMSSQRLVLPGLLYRSPPPQDKLCMLNCTVKRGFAGNAIHCKGPAIERCNIENAARCFSHCMQRVGLQGM